MGFKTGILIDEYRDEGTSGPGLATSFLVINGERYLLDTMKEPVDCISMKSLQDFTNKWRRRAGRPCIDFHQTRTISRIEEDLIEEERHEKAKP